jgi:hypothetical protein
MSDSSVLEVGPSWDDQCCCRGRLCFWLGRTPWPCRHSCRWTCLCVSGPDEACGRLLIHVLSFCCCLKRHRCWGCINDELYRRFISWWHWRSRRRSGKESFLMPRFQTFPLGSFTSTLKLKTSTLTNDAMTQLTAEGERNGKQSQLCLPS